jgi:hypothetical protein
MFRLIITTGVVMASLFCILKPQTFVNIGEDFTETLSGGSIIVKRNWRQNVDILCGKGFPKEESAS